MVDRRASQLIDELRLQPHPEGGFYRQIFRSALDVSPADGRGVRSALTTIYFLLLRSQHSRWHRVRSDEVWHHYEGAPLDLWQMTPDFDAMNRIALGAFDGATAPVHVVPADHWQAARSTGDYTLVGCTVGPGFVFDDFEMMRADSADAARLRERWPDTVALL
jgi:uncharacterized protein